MKKEGNIPLGAQVFLKKVKRAYSEWNERDVLKASSLMSATVRLYADLYKKLPNPEIQTLKRTAEMMFETIRTGRDWTAADLPPEEPSGDETA